MDLTNNTGSFVPFRFPVLKLADIAVCVEELDITVAITKKELLEPARHKEKFRKLFTQIVSHQSKSLETQVLSMAF